MKFRTENLNLCRVLQSVGRVSSGKSSLPILDYFLLELNGSTLSITASDGETTLRRKIEVDNENNINSSVAIPIKRTIDVLKELSSMFVTIDINEEDYSIKISWETGKANLTGANADLYPKMITLNKDRNELKLHSSVFYTAIETTSFAASDDTLRPVLSGVNVDISNTDITFVATDAHKLAKHTFDGVYPGGSDDCSFIIPKKPLAILSPLIAMSNGDVDISFDNKNILVELNDLNATFMCRLVEGSFPNYKSVIPTSSSKTVEIDRLEFLNAIKRVSVCASQSTNLAKLTFAEDKLTISAQDLDFAISATENIACSYIYEELEIGFKSSLLIEILSRLTCSKINIHLNDNTKPALIIPVGNEDCGSITMLAMPMLIN